MTIKIVRCLLACIIMMAGSVTWLSAQEKKIIRCGSMEVMQATFQRNAGLKTQFERQRQQVQKAVIERKTLSNNLRILGSVTYIPIVFHIVLRSPSIVTDAQIQAQVDKLNIDYAEGFGEPYQLYRR